MNAPHGIGMTNRFELFLDDDLDPLEILQRQEEEKQKRKLEKTQVKEKGKPSKTGKPVAPAKKAPETVPPKVTKQEEVPNKPRGKPTDRPNRNFTENREAEKNNRNRDDQQFFNPDNQRDGESRRGGRGGYRGRGGANRGRGGFYPNSENRPRRMFDRHSGSDRTGVRPTDKREGAGPGNWGDLRSDIKQRAGDTWDEGEQERPLETSTWGEEENEAPKFGEESSPKSGDDGEEGKENDQMAEEQVQDAVKEMTLDEWKKEQQAKRMVPKYNIRKPGEGEDDKQWKKGYVLKKKTKDEENEQDEDEEDEEESGRRGQQKVLLDIEFNFSDSRRGSRGRGRGGRGGPRGMARDGPNRDAPREDRFNKDRRSGPPKSKQAAPRVDDFNDFPSLAN